MKEIPGKGRSSAA